MNLIYSGQLKQIQGDAIFLAGCSPRKGQILLWRKDAIEFYRNSGFRGTLIIPEPEFGVWEDYLNVVEWEDFYLKKADKIVFWLPRSIKDGIYGFTSNVEFGKYLNSGKIIYGRPDDSDNNRYLDYWFKKLYQCEPFSDLNKMLEASLNPTNMFIGLQIEVIYHYAETDLKQTGERVVDLIVDGKYIYKEQDYYHDKVEDKIEGFLESLRTLKIPYNKVVKHLSDFSILND